MVKVLIHHKVADFANWKNAFDGFLDTRKEHGEVNYSVGTLHGQPDVAYVINDWTSKEAFDAFMSNPAMAEAMQAAGVLEAPSVIVLEEHSNGVTN
jgi:quinol monooxygenase YgiN